MFSKVIVNLISVKNSEIIATCKILVMMANLVMKYFNELFSVFLIIK